jgi:hypothetical protein
VIPEHALASRLIKSGEGLTDLRRNGHRRVQFVVEPIGAGRLQERGGEEGDGLGTGESAARSARSTASRSN